ncbi:hypothetical protein C4D60_Mb01t31170 [Musa balbisiana]|uniref:Uncharacterized protein n=1 Tax=Musa balbisiana TaxID=52838 RepID=A0A4S8JS33_MUSBA|nr:hypothetical protein C4D60_Mb01t31170 [Musa balbisiana]
MSSSEDEVGAEGAAPKGLGGGDSFPLRIGVTGCSTGALGWCHCQTERCHRLATERLGGATAGSGDPDLLSIQDIP